MHSIFGHGFYNYQLIWYILRFYNPRNLVKIAPPLLYALLFWRGGGVCTRKPKSKDIYYLYWTLLQCLLITSQARIASTSRSKMISRPTFDESDEPRVGKREPLSPVSVCVRLSICPFVCMFVMFSCFMFS